MGLKPHEKPADVYSLGSLLLELTAGAPCDDPKSLVLKVYHNYMYNKILKYDWLSSVLISALMTVFFIFWNEILLWNYTISLLRDQDKDFSFVLFSWCNKDLILRINLFYACSPYILLRSITISSQPTSPSEQRILNDKS